MKKLNKVFIVVDILAILVVIVLLVSPNILGDKFLNLLGLRVPKSEEQTIALKEIDNDLYVDTKTYFKSDNNYEEDILNHDESKPFKFMNLTIDDYNAYLLIVYNPANVKMMIGNGFNTPGNTGKLTVTDMVQKYGALAGVNGGGFYDNGILSTDRPIGYIIKDGEVLWGTQNRVGKLIGFNNENKLVLV